MRDLVPFVQLKNIKNDFSQQLYEKYHSSMGAFQVFLNCAKGTKSRKASYKMMELGKQSICISTLITVLVLLFISKYRLKELLKKEK